MTSALIGEFCGAFTIYSGIAAIWLIVAMIVPPLHKNTKVTYVTAMVLCALPQIVTYGGPGPVNLIAAIVCVLLLVMQMKRVEKKLLQIEV